MNKIILCSFTRNHLRFLIPMVKYLCEGGNEVLLYTNFAEIANDALAHKINEYSEKYSSFYALILVKNKDFLIMQKMLIQCLLLLEQVINIMLLTLIFVRKYLARLLLFSMASLRRVLQDCRSITSVPIK